MVVIFAFARILRDRRLAGEKAAKGRFCGKGKPGMQKQGT
jgi:hypothetical protein